MNHEETPLQYLRIIYKTPEFEAFYSALPFRVQTKFDYVINVISTIYSVPLKIHKASRKH